jgi:hypothetical protein
MILAALALLPATLHTQDSWGGWRSELRPFESDLATLCYLFHGRPSGVVGTTFVYDTREEQDCEKYLVQLLDAPKPYQRVLRDAAMFVVTRIYWAERGKEYFLATASHASQYQAKLQVWKSSSITPKDQLLRTVLISYLKLPSGRSNAQAYWLKSKSEVNSVRANVKKVLAKLVATQRAEDHWKTPGVYR